MVGMETWQPQCLLLLAVLIPCTSAAAIAAKCPSQVIQAEDAGTWCITEATGDRSECANGPGDSLNRLLMHSCPHVDFFLTTSADSNSAASLA
jgi:hypothetical protein